jgi:hypothetical protein
MSRDIDITRKCNVIFSLLRATFLKLKYIYSLRGAKTVKKPEFRPHAATVLRNERKNHFHDFVEEHGLTLEKKELLALYTGVWGVTTRTLEIYLSEYLATGALVKRGNHIVTAMQANKHIGEDFKRLDELSEIDE